MVHADASNFDEGVTKEDAYEQVLLQAEGLFYDQRNWQPLQRSGSAVARLSVSTCAQQPRFYVLDPSAAKPQLILGPFQGKVACQIIAFGRGVCGVAAASQATQLVQDVEQFPGHIACDSESKSEIVVPIVAKKDGEKKVVAIIDVDCAELNGFDAVDKKNLEQLAELIGKSCDW
ncbi:hypothetical protein LLEC1_06706 [Akanthomyces lecanii]|uniref:GAF domain-containing protein n=1 Tax=Cordyceps confragosa TaxID=2714763 RepID=A0A179I9G9_CORDF|nr:hypothetical protein LLEC1_06706 [Akanthomyces lecanii]